MSIKIKIFLLLFVIGITTSDLLAQTLPITLVTQSTPPHTANLWDLVAPGTNRVGLTMILRDANELSYQVRLEMTLEGNGIKLTSRKDVFFAQTRVGSLF